MNNLVQQIMKSSNPMGLVQNMIKTNPNIANAIPIVQELMKSGSKKEQLKKACEKSGLDYNIVEKQVKDLGINID